MLMRIFASISTYFFVNLYIITIWTEKLAKDYSQLSNVFLYDLIHLMVLKWCLPLNCVTVVKAANSDKQLNKKIANKVQTGFYATTTCLLFILEPVPNIQVWSDVNSVPSRLRNGFMYLYIYTIYTHMCKTNVKSIKVKKFCNHQQSIYLKWGLLHYELNHTGNSARKISTFLMIQHQKERKCTTFCIYS